MITKPKGTYDLYGMDERIYSYITNVIDDYMHNYNYNKIRTPLIEYSDLFHRGVGETTDIVTKETYDFKDRGERLITLRPEGTAGVVRSLIENKFYGNRNDTIKFYYNGTMYRYERPQSGRNREFTQFGVEAFNSNDPMIDAEIISIGYNIFKELGIEDVTVNLNTLGDAETRKNYTEVLVKYLIPHKDELCNDCQNRLLKNPLRILDCKIDKDNEIIKNVPKISNYLTDESRNKFQKIKDYLNILDVDYEVNENIIRGLDYYDHDVWEYINSKNITLGAGGRYDHLVENLGGPAIPAVGFALGFERIINELKLKISENNFKNDIDVYIMSINEEEKMYAIKISQDLRLNGLKVEINSANLSLKSQFKLADSLNAKQLVILNWEDLNKGLISVKDNATKETQKIDEAELVDYLLGVM